MFSVASFKQRLSQPSGAVMSDCRTYRYLLWRIWDNSKPMMAYVLLNPSTADHEQNDPTMTRCIRRAGDLGFGGMWVVNLFALRSTDPAGLYSHKDPVGSLNNEALMASCGQAGLVLCGWGNHGRLNGRGAEVAALLRQKKLTVQCLRVSGQNQPMHPLYLPYGIAPVDFLL